uniref:Uncharacterized protein n=1 Tax=Branchiostoma floridae TaxID=7739 RepID=C3ZJU4_BRAFL|eukprot:XP_002591218.1 hypothetical protein BRAFLDRAFT_106446 [Branchiostoma floridae]
MFHVPSVVVSLHLAIERRSRVEWFVEFASAFRGGRDFIRGRGRGAFSGFRGPPPPPIPAYAGGYGAALYQDGFYGDRYQFYLPDQAASYAYAGSRYAQPTAYGMGYGREYTDPYHHTIGPAGYGVRVAFYLPDQAASYAYAGSRYAQPTAYGMGYGREYTDPYHHTIGPAGYGVRVAASVYRGGYSRFAPY